MKKSRNAAALFMRKKKKKSAPKFRGRFGCITKKKGLLNHKFCGAGLAFVVYSIHKIDAGF